MPNYDYKCKNCEEVIEINHSINETPEVLCPFCKTPMFKKMPLVSFSSHDTINKVRELDNKKRHTEKRFDLQSNYHVHEVTPVKGDFDGVYSEIKGSGSRVKDLMQERMGKTKIKKAETEKKQAEGRAKRVKERVAKIKDRKAKEAAKDRAITL